MHYNKELVFKLRVLEIKIKYIESLGFNFTYFTEQLNSIKKDINLSSLYDTEKKLQADADAIYRIDYLSSYLSNADKLVSLFGKKTKEANELLKNKKASIKNIIIKSASTITLTFLTFSVTNLGLLKLIKNDAKDPLYLTTRNVYSTIYNNSNSNIMMTSSNFNFEGDLHNSVDSNTNTSEQVLLDIYFPLEVDKSENCYYKKNTFDVTEFKTNDFSDYIEIDYSNLPSLDNNQVLDANFLHFVTSTEATIKVVTQIIQNYDINLHVDYKSQSALFYIITTMLLSCVFALVDAHILFKDKSWFGIFSSLSALRKDLKSINPTKEELKKRLQILKDFSVIIQDKLNYITQISKEDGFGYAKKIKSNK